MASRRNFLRSFASCSSMAFRRTLVHKLFNISNIATPTIANCRISSPSSFKTLVSHNPDVFMPPRSPPRSGESVMFGENLSKMLKELNLTKNRLNLDGLGPPEAKSSGVMEEERKVVRLLIHEMIKSKLREIRNDTISHEDFIQICAKSCSSRELGLEFAKSLEESGTVIFWRNIVYLRPEKVAKVMEMMISPSTFYPDDRRKDMTVEAEKELAEMEKKKAAIDRMAEKLARRELGLGLGFFAVQTLFFMRLTFWELSWDVMEPICFYFTSFYFMAGYAFYLRTSKEPSFDGFFQNRVSSKKKRLMDFHRFDIRRYDELLRLVSAGRLPSGEFPAISARS